MTHRNLLTSVAFGIAALSLSTSLARADFVINDDLIVDGCACIGFDCVNGESLRLRHHPAEGEQPADQVRRHLGRRQLPAQRLAADRQRLGQRRRQQVLDRRHHRQPHAVHRRGQRPQPLALRRRRRPHRLPHLDPVGRDPHHRRRHADPAPAAGRLLRLRAADLGRGRQRDQLLHPRRHQRLAAAVPHPPRRADQLDLHRRQRRRRAGNILPGRRTARHSQRRERHPAGRGDQRHDGDARC